MWLTRIALKNPIFILMACLMSVVVGLVSLNRLPVDLFPEINLPVVQVATFYPGAGPADVEQTITVPIERAVAAAPGVIKIESSSKQGFSRIRVWFSFGSNLDNAQFEVSQRISQILNTLPAGLSPPFVLKFDITNIPVVQIGISVPGLDERELYDLAFNVIQPQLERVPGVASASVGGGKIREITVALRREALTSRGIDVLDVLESVRAANLLLPSGTLKAGDREYNVFTATMIEDGKQLEDVVVRPARPNDPNGSPVFLRDVADIHDAVADQAEIVRINGERGVYLRVLKQPDANTIAVVNGIEKQMQQLMGVPPTAQLKVSFDQSRYIRNAITSLQHEALQGGLLAGLVILFFLLSLRATGIISIAIPLSIIATFALLFFTGQTLNVFTLGGLALGVGRMVDDSIVELENIHRHLEHATNRTRAVLDAAQEVAQPIFVATITTIVVFFPIVFVAGVGKFLFVPLALSFSFSLAMSFLVSRTVTPILCLRLLKSHADGPQKKNPIAATIERALTALDNGYASALRFTLRHRAIVIVTILAIFVASLSLFRLIGSEFFPQTDESQFTINLRAPMGTRVELTEQVSKRIESSLVTALGDPVKGDGELRTVISNLGVASGRMALFSPNTGPHGGNIQVNLIGPTERSLTDLEAAEKVRKTIGDSLPGMQLYFFVGGIVKRILNFGASAPISVEVLGFDLDTGSAYARQLATALKALNLPDGRPQLTDVQVSREDSYPELNIHVDRAKAGISGVTERQAAQSVLASLAGNSQFAPVPFIDPKTGNQYNVTVRMRDEDRANVHDIAEIPLRSASGGITTLGAIATIDRDGGPVEIARKYMQRMIEVTANAPPWTSLGEATAAVEKALAENPPPEGFTVNVAGQSEAQKEAFSSLIFAAGMALLLVYMILASQFKSLVDPLVIMFSVPLGITGVALALWLTGTTLNVNSFMGIIMMVGIVVSNGVLLVDFANVLRERGVELLDATVEAGKTRLRPILMTTIATIFGLLPMAMGLGEGSETNLPLARAVIGGLTVSTFFTLFLIPTLYTLLERFAKRVVYMRDDEV